MRESFTSELTISTHVVDTVNGAPAVGVPVALYRGDELVASDRTGEDGRIPALGSGLRPGTYRLAFETRDHFGGAAHLYRRVILEVELDARHHHLPLLLGPYSIIAYRGV